MKIIRVTTRCGAGSGYTLHGIGHTEHSGYSGTSDNRMPIRDAVRTELRNIQPGEEYQIEINGKNRGIFVKPS